MNHYNQQSRVNPCSAVSSFLPNRYRDCVKYSIFLQLKNNLLIQQVVLKTLMDQHHWHLSELSEILHINTEQIDAVLAGNTPLKEQIAFKLIKLLYRAAGL